VGELAAHLPDGDVADPGAQDCFPDDVHDLAAASHRTDWRRIFEAMSSPRLAGVMPLSSRNSSPLGLPA
jgi:hypothetical protein